MVYMLSTISSQNPPKIRFNPRYNSYLLLISLFFVASLVVTVIAWIIVAKTIENRVKESFYLVTNTSVSWIQTRLDTYADILTGIAAFVENKNQLSLAQWNSYIDRLEILQRYLGLRSINYLRRVKPDDKDNFIRETIKNSAQDEDYQNYTIKSIDPNYSKTQNDYYPVVYSIAPLDGHHGALGLDVSSEKRRQEALFLARDTARITTTDFIKFVPIPTNIGFSMVLPIYNNNLPTNTLSQLSKAFSGAIYAPFDIKMFFDGVLMPGNEDAFPNLDFEVYDETAEHPEQPVYDKNPNKNIRNDSASFAVLNKKTLSFSNRRWEIYTGIPTSVIKDPKWTSSSFSVLVGGIFTSFLSFLILLVQYFRLLRSQ